MEVIFLIGMAEATFLAVLIFSKKNKSVADYVLAIWMLFIGLHLLFHYFHYTKLDLQYTHLLAISAFFPILQGPFLFVYVAILINEKGEFKKSYLWHALPFIFFMTYGMFDFYLLGAEKKLEYYLIIDNSAPFLYSIGFFLNISLGPFYLLWSLILLKRHKRIIAEKFSYTEQITLNWLIYVLISMGLIWFTVLITTIVNDILELLPTEFGSDLIYISVTIAVFIMGYFGFRQQSIYTNVSIESARVALNKHAVKEQNQAPNIKIESFRQQAERYGKSGLKDSEAITYLDKLLQFMDKEKPYLDNNLSLKHLAELMNLSTNHLSQIINEKLNKNFFDFINEYRVNEVKQYLSNPKFKHYTLLAIAYESGFNSKSSFNSIFKKNTDLTPSEFQKNLEI